MRFPCLWAFLSLIRATGVADLFNDACSVILVVLFALMKAAGG